MDELENLLKEVADQLPSYMGRDDYFAVAAAIIRSRYYISPRPGVSQITVTNLSERQEGRPPQDS